MTIPMMPLPASKKLQSLQRSKTHFEGPLKQGIHLNISLLQSPIVPPIPPLWTDLERMLTLPISL